MATIRDILSALTDNQKRILYYAIEHGISQHIEFSPGEFIGVNAEHIKFLEIQQTAGQWSIGKVKS